MPPLWVEAGQPPRFPKNGWIGHLAIMSILLMIRERAVSSNGEGPVSQWPETEQSCPRKASESKWFIGVARGERLPPQQW